MTFKRSPVHDRPRAFFQAAAKPGATAVVATASAALPVEPGAPLCALLRKRGSTDFSVGSFSIDQPAIGFQLRFLLNRFQLGVLLLLHLELFCQLLGGHGTVFKFFIQNLVIEPTVLPQALLANFFFQGKTSFFLGTLASLFLGALTSLFFGALASLFFGALSSFLFSTPF